MPFAIRLKVRSSKGITLDETSTTFVFNGMEVTLTKEDGSALRQPGWFVFCATGFPTQGQAEEFGERLMAAVSVTSIQQGWGVDFGQHKPTLQLGASVVEAIERTGVIYRPNIHGLDVFEDTGDIVRMTASAVGLVAAVSDDLLSGFIRNADVVLEQPSPLSTAVTLLNEAMMVSGAAQLALAIAAVESLCPDLAWSQVQKDEIAALVHKVAESSNLTVEEGEEIKVALERMHRLSIRQGLMRLLERLDLREIRNELDEVYGARSAFFHGASYLAGPELNALAGEAYRIARRIVLRAVERQSDSD